MRYVCGDCGQEIEREELENSKKIRCPNCGSYRIRKEQD